MTLSPMPVNCIGLMSGTSMDGIDAALISTDGLQYIQALDAASLPYPSEFQLLLKALEYTLYLYQGDMHEVEKRFLATLPVFLKLYLNLVDTDQKKAELEDFAYTTFKQPLTCQAIIQYSSLLHAELIKELLKKSGYKKEQIVVIGYHGQTLYHQPNRQISIQIGDPALLATVTGITTVSQFRQNDIAAGGQGAPLAPLYHRVLAIRDKRLPLLLLNCGGIANLTAIYGKRDNELWAYDCGPGNVLLDRLVRQRTHGFEQMDKEGHYALQGKVQETILQELLQNAIKDNEGRNYLQLKPPKSLDTHNCHLLPCLEALSLEDACATLTAFSIEAIYASLRWLPKPIPSTWILAGGGWNNHALTSSLMDRLKKMQVQVLSASAIGWDNKALEAQIFAYLAVRCLQGLPLSLPQTTGVAAPCTGGRIYSP